jgi:hypothetical protein
MPGCGAGHTEPRAGFPASYRNVVAVLRLSRVAPAQKTRGADLHPEAADIDLACPVREADGPAAGAGTALSRSSTSA